MVILFISALNLLKKSFFYKNQNRVHNKRATKPVKDNIFLVEELSLIWGGFFLKSIADELFDLTKSYFCLQHSTSHQYII